MGERERERMKKEKMGKMGGGVWNQVKWSRGRKVKS